MSAATFGVFAFAIIPAYRCAHAGYLLSFPLHAGQLQSILAANEEPRTRSAENYFGLRKTRFIMRTGWKLLMVKLALASVTCSASAQGLSPIAFEELKPVFDRTIQLQRDVLSAGKGIVAARAGLSNALCFFELSQNLTQLTSELLRLQTLVLIADDMHDPYDVRTVLSQVKDVAAVLLKTIEADRPTVNRVPSDCPTNNFVAAKSSGTAESVHICNPVLRAIVSRI
jgi:hypothetical protein